MKIGIFVLRIILVIIAIPFMIIPAICIGGVILLDKWESHYITILNHTNTIYGENDENYDD